MARAEQVANTSRDCGEGLAGMNFTKKMMVRPGTKIDLSDFDANETFGYADDRKTEAKQAKILKRLDQLQYLFYGVKDRALLIVLQGMDTGGKDGTIRHVMSGMSPQGCRVTSFKTPTPEELAHDFLWRIHKATPEKGIVGIFNRSQYEDVLVLRVHKLVPKKVWKARYDEINEFEKLLAQNQVHIVKFFLHISKDEQKKRLRDRLTDPAKLWKMSEADFAERKYWDDYVSAYEDVLSRCSTERAPWFVIPANHKWFRNLAVSKILEETFENFDMQLPQPTVDVSKIDLR
jgi:PPK2 family polyphosphate:nucleotide phosphotransferase